jgi:hypothetical protein
MTDDHYRHADNGGVLNAAVAAVMLITAGLALMAWEEYRDVRDAAVTVSVSRQQ